LIELKLIIEADQQSLIIAQNQALPRVDATMLYRWNGLEGQTPSGALIGTNPGQFADWTLGVNFSVPLGLRQSRAGLRRSELLLARDRANLEQGVHFAAHTLAGNLRNLAQFFEQYKAYKQTRTAAHTNLEQQLAEYRFGRAIFLNVLQAITDWGNSVSSEAQALAQYNIELANLERQTGTILETHGIRFVEERFRSIGPLGRCADWPCYPKSVVPTANEPKYPAGTEPAEKALEREKPSIPALPPPTPSKEN
jgi:outer membrane protein TolC